MSSELNIIIKRLQELDADDKRLSADIQRLENQRVENQREREEINAAGKVLARLTGAEWPTAGQANAEPAAKTSGAKPEGIPAMPELIMSVLAEGPAEGMEPKDITAAIAERWWPSVDNNTVASSAWRLWKKTEKLVKDDGSSLYRLPGRDEAPDEKLDGEPSEASLFQPDPEAHGLKAGPGGGG